MSEGSQEEPSKDVTDGPPPMRHFKPAKMNPNSADQFQEHQKEYEVHGRRTNYVDRVHQHNSGYPKLRDELDRRRTLTKVTAIKRNHQPNSNFFCGCDMCLKIRKKDLKAMKAKDRRVRSRVIPKRCNHGSKKARNNVMTKHGCPCPSRIPVTYIHRGSHKLLRNEDTRHPMSSKRPKEDDASERDNSSHSTSVKRHKSEDRSRHNSVGTELSDRSYKSTLSDLDEEPMI